MARNRRRSGGNRQSTRSSGSNRLPVQLKAPFRFARINRWIYEPDWAPLVSHDVPFADGLCGEAEVEITAKSAILVGGERQQASDDAVGKVHPFQLPDDGYAIPGSALQGMARSILEVAAFGRLGPWVEDRKFGIRDLSETTTAKEHYRSRLNSKAGWLVRISKEERVVYPCQFARIGLDDILRMKTALSDGRDANVGILYRKSDAAKRYEWFLDGLKGGKDALDAQFSATPQGDGGSHPRCQFDVQGEIQGTLVLTGKPQDSVEEPDKKPQSDNAVPRGHKKREFVFHSPDRTLTSTDTPTSKNTSPLSVPGDAWTAFEFLHDEQPGRPINPNWAFWKGEFEAGRPIPVFYWENGEPPGRIETLGMAFAFKAAHLKSARALLEHSCPGHTESVAEMKLDLPHLLFGVAAEHDGGRGLKRRASFGLARALGDPKPKEPDNPSILLGPKPSYVGLYVRQRDDGKPIPKEDPMATYTPLRREQWSGQLHLASPELAGVKIWPTRGGAGEFKPKPVDDKLKKNKKVQTKLVTLPPGTRFRSRLSFHNLRPVELGALLWALSFGDKAAFGEDPAAITKRHRLGMGKPLGLGDIVIRVTGLETELADPARAPAQPKGAAAFIDVFEDHMRDAYGEKWSESKQVKALIKAATPAENSNERLEYMTLEEYQKARATEYLRDYVPEGDEKPRSSTGAPPESSGGLPSLKFPKPGDRVQAVLIDEKTKKGKWKARIAGGGMIGDIMNSEAVPGDAKPGQEVSLIVRVARATNGSFYWPTDEVAAKFSRPAPTGRGRRKQGRNR